MSDSELDGFPVLDSNDLGNIPSVNYESNSQPQSVQNESKSSSAENSKTQNDKSVSKQSSPHLIPPSSIDLPSLPSDSNNDFQVAQQTSKIISIEQKKSGNSNYSKTIDQYTQPLMNENDQIDYGSLDQQIEEESCRRTCLKIFFGLCCNFEDTVYTYTQPLNAELDKMNSQLHHCFDSFFHNLCGCNEQMLNE